MMADALADQISEFRRALESVRAAIAAGATVDLLGFDAGISGVLEEAQRAPRAERQALIAALEELLEEVDAVGLELRLHRDADAARQALSAYTDGDPR